MSRQRDSNEREVHRNYTGKEKLRKRQKTLCIIFGELAATDCIQRIQRKEWAHND